MNEDEPFDAEAVRAMVVPHKTRLDRRKATYGVYRFSGRARDYLSWLPGGARVEYVTEEREGRDLELVARADGQEAARARIDGQKDASVRVSTSSPTLLGRYAVLYASGLAMTWGWVEQIDVVVPQPIARDTFRVLASRTHLVRDEQRSKATKDGLRASSFRVVSRAKTKKP